MLSFMNVAQNNWLFKNTTFVYILKSYFKEHFKVK